MSQRTTNNRLAERISQRFRDKRSAELKALLLASRPQGDTGRIRVLDLGGRVEFWKRLGLDFLQANDVHVTILNLTDAERGNDIPLPDHFSLVLGDACATGLPDDAFDVVMSNSVIEHLVTFPNMIAFAGETRRLAKSYYCQTPNFWFPVDPHYYRFPFFHWLPRPTRAWLFRNFTIANGGKARTVLKSYELIDAARLLSKAQMMALFPDAELRKERVLGLFVKSLVAVRSAAAK